MLKQLIKSSPGFIEKPARYIYTSLPDYIRYGKNFRSQYKFLNKSQWWTSQQHEEYQFIQLKKLLEHSYKNVPYYTNIFTERGIKPENIKSFKDLKKLPYLTKELVRNNLKDLVAKNYNIKKLKIVTTSGTSRIPMDFYIEPIIDKAREWSFIVNLWNRIGYDPKKINNNVILRGIIPKNGLYEYKGKDLILSSFQMTEENMKNYVELIKGFNPDFIQAYPSSIHLLSKYILRNKLVGNFHKLKCILCSSENLFDNQRLDIEQAFRVRVYNFYGHSEHACLGGECELSNYFHIQSEYGYTEIINEDGQDVKEEGEIGEIVATGFNNFAMPFIRYKTEDLVVNSNEKCNCGRNYKLIIKVEGRKQEFLIDMFGRAITATWAGFPLRQIEKKINSFQYIQNEPGTLLLNIKSFEEITDEDIKNIKKVFDLHYKGFELQIKSVENIERIRGGKFKFLVQNIDVNTNES
ncbi:phenylacetate--CoA ligase family protein [Candidatus Clostridium radicumherbarum]|uniref:Phenylacetate--CoA ligase family protein n=1 Tax=Candidatus Clostridium radicumherbarum TaxID=3381662 RepID=A0ABW8TSI1_9CLOT